MARINITVGPGLLLVPVAIYAGYKLYKSAKAAKEAGANVVNAYGPYVNPADQNNFVYWAYNWPLRAAGSDNTIGTFIYEVLHGEDN